MTTTTLPFFAGELSAFTPSDSSVTESTSGNYSSTFSRCCIYAQNRYATATSPTWAAAATLWFHAFMVPNARSGGGQPQNTCLNFYSGSTVVAQLFVNTFNSSIFTWDQLTLKTLQGGAMTALSPVYIPTNTLGNATLQNLDVMLVAGASGSAAVYMGGTKLASATGLNHASWSGVTGIVLVALDDNNFGIVTNVSWSQIICDTTCTIGRAVVTDNFSSESATNTGWSTYGGGTKLANINEVVLSDATGITSSTTGQIDTFYQSGLSYGTYNVLARGVSARAGYLLAAPTQVRLAIRVSSTNYLSSPTALATYYQATYNSWTTNPATSAAWTASAAAAIEAGVQSLT